MAGVLDEGELFVSPRISFVTGDVLGPWVPSLSRGSELVL